MFLQVLGDREAVELHELRRLVHRLGQEELDGLELDHQHVVRRVPREDAAAHHVVVDPGLLPVQQPAGTALRLDAVGAARDGVRRETRLAVDIFSPYTQAPPRDLSISPDSTH